MQVLPLSYKINNLIRHRSVPRHQNYSPGRIQEFMLPAHFKTPNFRLSPVPSKFEITNTSKNIKSCRDIIESSKLPPKVQRTQIRRYTSKKIKCQDENIDNSTQVSSGNSYKRRPSIEKVSSIQLTLAQRKFEKQTKSLKQAIGPSCSSMEATRLRRISDNILIQKSAFNKDYAAQKQLLLSSLIIKKSLNNYCDISERFTILKTIGKGKFGDVYQASDKLTGQIVALKILQKYLLEQEYLKDLILEEIKIQSHLDHPNILKIYGILHDQNQMVLVLESCEQDLGQYFKRKQFDIESDSIMLLQIAAALAYMHKQGIIHRDIKLENILIQGQEIKLADFGLSKYEPEFLNNPKHKLYPVAGTYGYMAPEVVNKQGYNLKSDAYSFGALIYELFNKKVPSYTADYMVPCYSLTTFHSLLHCLLQHNPQERCSIVQILKHPFFIKANYKLSTQMPKQQEIRQSGKAKLAKIIPNQIVK